MPWAVSPRKIWERKDEQQVDAGGGGGADGGEEGAGVNVGERWGRRRGRRGRKRGREEEKGATEAEGVGRRDRRGRNGNGRR